MGTARNNQYKSTDAALEASIAKKIAPLKIETLKDIADHFGNYLKKVQTQFAITDDEFLSQWEKYGNRDHIQFYKENGLWAFSIELLSLAGRPDLQKKVQSSPFQFLIEIVANKIKPSTPEQQKQAEQNCTDEKVFRLRALYRAGMLDGYAQLFSQKSMFTLLKEALSGNDESLFKAISIDKNLVADKTISQRINQETMRHNKAFIASLSDALGTPLSLPQTASRLKMFCFLALTLIFSGLRKSTDEELSYLLKKLDIYDITPDTLRVTRKRLGLVKSVRVPVDYDKMLQSHLPDCNKNTPT